MASAGRPGRLAPAGAAFVLLAAATGAIAQTHYPIFTVDNFVGTMKTVGRNFAGVNQSVSNSDFDAAKAQLARSREQLAITITFWRDRGKDDAVQMLKQTLTTMDALDDALSAGSVDAAAVGARVKQVGAACQACHAVYREQDPDTKAYRLKAGLAKP